MAPRPDRVRIETADGVASVAMTRGDKHNGLDWPMFESLNAALDELAGAADVRCVVLHGEGPSFCAGLDFKSVMGDGEDAGHILDRELEVPNDSPANPAQRVAYGWRELEVPVVAALQGHVLGGGFQIALGADIRIAAPGTRMSRDGDALRADPRHGPVPHAPAPGPRRRRARADLHRPRRRGRPRRRSWA